MASKTLEYIEKTYPSIPSARKLGYREIPNASRTILADVCHALDFKIGVEVGVERGRFSEAIVSKNPQMHLYGIDPYESYFDYTDFVLKSTFNKNEAEAHSRLDKYPNYTFIKKYSTDAGKDFEDNSVDLVYIDANHHFEYVIADIALWTKKLRPGGIISGHDYFLQSGKEKVQVYAAVNAWTAVQGIKWFVIGAEAKDGLIRDDLRSWFWIK